MIDMSPSPYPPRHETIYDDTGAVTKQIADSGPGGLNLTTETTEWDMLGRPVDTYDPNGNRTHYSYIENAALREVRATRFVDQTTLGLSDVVTDNWSAGILETGTLSGGANGVEGFHSGGAIRSATRDWLDYGGRVVRSDRYFRVDVPWTMIRRTHLVRQLSIALGRHRAPCVAAVRCGCRRPGRSQGVGSLRQPHDPSGLARSALTA
jgi:YD repeat-containing protein